MGPRQPVETAVDGTERWLPEYGQDDLDDAALERAITQARCDEYAALRELDEVA